MNYTVTGATGHLGRIVVQDMLKMVGAESLRAAVHTPAKAAALQQQGIATVKADYLDVPTMVDALQGTDVLIYIPSKTYDVLQRVTEFENTLTAMKAANVSQIVFVSFYADQEDNPFTMSPYYAYAPRRLAGSGLQYAVVKNALYADPLVPYLPELIERQALIYPVGDAAMSFIAQNDSAEAIATVAVKPELRGAGQVYTVTQNEAYTMPRLGEVMTAVTGRTIGYQPVSVAEFGRIYAAEGDGDELGSMYAGGAKGELGLVTDDFKTITGRHPEDMTHFLKTRYQR